MVFGWVAIILHLFSFVLIIMSYMMEQALGLQPLLSDEDGNSLATPDNIEAITNQYNATIEASPEVQIFGDWAAGLTALRQLFVTGLDFVSGGPLIEALQNLPFVNDGVTYLIRGIYSASTFFLLLFMATGRSL